MAVYYGVTTVRVNQFVVVLSPSVFKARPFQQLYEFPCCHDYIMRIMRIDVNI